MHSIMIRVDMGGGQNRLSHISNVGGVRVSQATSLSAVHRSSSLTTSEAKRRQRTRLKRRGCNR
jgi:hypothetical protein